MALQAKRFGLELVKINLSIPWRNLMGGDRETMVKKSFQEQDLGQIRVHESNREVHFHDDANNLKVAVPTATWFDAWSRLSSGQRKKWKYVDTEEGTQLKINMNIATGADVAELSPNLKVEEIQFSPTFKQLQSFTHGA